MSLRPERPLQHTQYESDVLQMMKIETALDSEQIRKQFQTRLSYSLLDEGKINIAGDMNARWQMAADGNRKFLELIQGWTCPTVTGGLNWFILKSLRPYPVAEGEGFEAEHAVMRQMASRPHCV